MSTNIFQRIAQRFIVPANVTVSNGAAFDIEGDGLRNTITKLHCIVITELNGDRVYEYDHEHIEAGLEHLGSFDYLVGHNIVNFDLPVLQRLHNWAPRPECRILDTLIAGRLILPHIADLDDQAAAMGDPKLGKLRGRYSLDAWGARLGIPKVGADITDWSRPTAAIRARCVGDNAICKRVWQLLQTAGYSQYALELEHRVAPLCEEITATGIDFDIDAAKRLEQQWTARRDVLEAQLHKEFPGVNLNSRQQIGALLEQRGWVPEQRTEKKKLPKIDDETLETISALYPEFAGLSEHYILGRRLAQLAHGDKAWIKHVGVDGRIHGGIVHVGAPHSRAVHREPNLAQVPNPKRGTAFATECRSLFKARDGWVLVACDQATLQDRGFAHYLTEFDGGAYAKDFLAGVDTHWRTATALDLVNHERNKESKPDTIIREGSKGFRYAFLYGAGGPRLGLLVANIIRAVHRIDPGRDLPKRFFGGQTHPKESAISRVGKQSRDKFEAATPGLRQLRTKLQNFAERHGWLPAIDGRRVPVRAQYKALNYIVTSSEAIICKRWLVRTYDALCAKFRYGWDGDVVICLWVHDEIVACCRPEIAEQVGEIMVRNAKEAGAFYHFKVGLAADFKIALNWGGGDSTAATAEIETIAPAETPSIAPEPVDDMEEEPDDGAVDDDDRVNETVVVETPIPGLEDAIADVRAFIAAIATGASPLAGEGSGSPQAPNAPHAGNGRASGNGFDRSHGDYRNAHAEAHAGDADKPYGPIRARLLSQGYRVAKTFPFTVPGEGAPRFYEDRYELKPELTPTKDRPRKTSRYWHQEKGRNLNGTGPRRIIFNWPAIMRAAPDATVFITEGANKSAALNQAGLLATAAPYHQWGPECVAALSGRHLIYHEDHDLPDASGVIKAKGFSADACKKLGPGAASLRIVPALHLWKSLEHVGAPPHGWDVKDWLEEWTKRDDDPVKLLDICREIPTEGTQFTFIDMSSWDLEPAPEQEWIVYNRVPRRECVLFSGEGGAGKSIEQLHLSIAAALGRDWLGAALEQGPTIFIDAEDDEKVLQRRTKLIAAYYDTSVDDMIKGGLRLMSWRGCDAALAVVAHNGKIESTPLYQQLLEAAGDIKPVLIGIAASANVFAGNENDRAQVQQFVGLLTRVAMVANGSVVLISHPSLAGINTETGLSGTTQWHNSVRARYFMRSVKPEDGEPLDADLREIVFKKNNYGSISESIQLRWNKGLFLPVSDAAVDQATRDATAQDVFLVLLKRFRAQNRHVSDKPSSNYAPALFAREQEAMGAGLTRSNLKRAMRLLFQRNAIWNEPCGKPSRPSYRIAPKI